MKRIITSILVLALTIGAAQAQSTDSAQHHQHIKGQRKEMRMSFSRLGLSPEQKDQIKTIRSDFRSKMADLKKQDQITVAEMRKRKKELHRQFREKTMAVLTPAQKEKLAKMRSDAKNRHNGRSTAFRKRINGMLLQKELALSAQQQEQLKKMRTETHEKMSAIRQDQSLTAKQRKAEVKGLLKERKEQLKTVLTTEQWEKLQQLKKERMNDESK